MSRSGPLSDERLLVLLSALSQDVPLGARLRDGTPPRVLLEGGWLPEARRARWRSRAAALASSLPPLGAAQLIPLGHSDYPSRLLQLPEPPLALFLWGNAAVLRHQPAVTLVGTRRASALALKRSRRWGEALAGLGVAVYSGLALGIDAACHRGVVVKGGAAVAVVAGCPFTSWPRRHERLAEDVLAGGGAILSEFPPGVRPRRASFPRRNRLLAALTPLTVVIEAGLRSGALGTARAALEMGADVGAVPAAPEATAAAGCLQLLADGAALIRGPVDIVGLLGGNAVRPPEAARSPLLEAIWGGAHSIDALALRTGLAPGAVTAGVLELSLAGTILWHADGRLEPVA